MFTFIRSIHLPSSISFHWPCDLTIKWNKLELFPELHMTEKKTVNVRDYLTNAMRLRRRISRTRWQCLGRSEMRHKNHGQYLQLVTHPVCPTSLLCFNGHCVWSLMYTLFLNKWTLFLLLNGPLRGFTKWSGGWAAWQLTSGHNKYQMKTQQINTNLKKNTLVSPKRDADQLKKNVLDVSACSRETLFTLQTSPHLVRLRRTRLITFL